MCRARLPCQLRPGGRRPALPFTAALPATASAALSTALPLGSPLPFGLQVLEVCDWLELIGLGQYRRRFVHHAICGSLLLGLGNEQLKAGAGGGGDVRLWWFWHVVLR